MVHWSQLLSIRQHPSPGCQSLFLFQLLHKKQDRRYTALSLNLSMRVPLSIFVRLGLVQIGLERFSPLNFIPHLRTRALSCKLLELTTSSDVQVGPLRVIGLPMGGRHTWAITLSVRHTQPTPIYHIVLSLVLSVTRTISRSWYVERFNFSHTRPKVHFSLELFRIHLSLRNVWSPKCKPDTKPSFTLVVPMFQL